MDEQEIKERNVYSIIGEDGFEKLTRAFYRSGFNGRGPIGRLCHVFVSLLSNNICYYSSDDAAL
jgi:hypothetical protein